MLFRGPAVCAIAALLALTGCTAGPSGTRHAGHTTTPATGSTTSHGSSPRILTDVSDCASPTASDRAGIPDPSAPAYAGPGPHRVVIGQFVDLAGEEMSYAGGQEFDLPASWVSFSNDQRPLQDPSHAQLIVCLTGARKSSAKAIGTCQYDVAAADVYPARLTYEVFEAKTGRRVARTTIPSGEADIDVSCPESMVSTAGATAPVAQAPKGATFRSWLRPLVLDPAR
jgi:hypothetical protein